MIHPVGMRGQACRSSRAGRHQGDRDTAAQGIRGVDPLLEVKEYRAEGLAFQ